jgi:hypothetical protein
MNQEIKIPTKDELIVRQSQLERSIEIFQLTGRKPSIQEICRLSKVLTEFIFTGDYNTDALKNFDKWTGNELKQELVDKLTPKNK